MAGQEAVPTDARIFDLPAEEIQQQETIKEEVNLLDLSNHPGWRHVKEKFEAIIARYTQAKYDPTMPLEDIGKQVLIAQTIGLALQEALNEVSTTVDAHSRDQ
jgi:hypothetical protein